MMTEDEFRKIFGSNIQKYRQSLGLTQEKTAELAKISPGHLADIINGRRFPGVPILLRLSEALGVQPFELFVPLTDKPYETDRDKLRNLMVEIRDTFTTELETKLKGFLSDTPTSK